MILQKDIHSCSRCGSKMTALFSNARNTGPFRVICPRCANSAGNNFIAPDLAVKSWNAIN